uniref:EF-hand domain-containing protein n=1 Tax=Mucochytrium quahogii TaxID=96639 RepID=A0A7S2RDR3_9STRA|mmetsp:Transcript_19177/g.31439  ORF Transcript_19177/g.31439 Transcript_19177/m.31439 type:complete len:423 (+) Transcript_19177:132-1400(+)
MFSRKLLASRFRAPLLDAFVSSRFRAGGFCTWDKFSTGTGYEFMAKEGVLVPLFKTFAREQVIQRNVGDQVVELKETVLTRQELEPLLKSLGEFPTEKEVNAIFSLADSDKNGVIDLQEFISSCDKLLQPISGESRPVHSIDIMIQRFNTLDKDMDGFISVNDLEGLLTTGGGCFTAKEAEELVKEADQDGNNLIDLQEFIALLTSKKASTKHWRLRSAFRTIYIVGGPACGKGTLCARIAEHAQIQHISCGEILREEVQAQTPLGKEIEAIIARGELVEPAVVLALLRVRMAEHPGCIVLLDGFPRSQQNAEDFNAMVGKPSLVVYLECPPDTMVNRIIKRGEQSAPGEKRSDDNIETARNRIETFNKQGKPTLEYLEKIDIPVLHLDATKSPDEVWQQLLDSDNIISKRVKLLLNAYQPS